MDNMTRSEAIEILNNWIEEQVDVFGGFQIPLTDEVIYTEGIKDEVKQFTFTQLIKIVYDI